MDCFHAVCPERLRHLCENDAVSADVTTVDKPGRLVHFSCPTLAHLIALLCRPTESALPSDTALIVVDSLSALINHAFPRTPPSRSASKGNKGPSPSSRRIQVLQYIVGALQKLAATRDAAVVVLTQCATKMLAERGATLTPAVNAHVWEQGMATRVALFRDWAWKDGSATSARFAGVQKINGKVASDALEKAYAFEIRSTGIVPVCCDDVQSASMLPYDSAQKRKLGNTDFEVPDSEDEDYGWQKDDDSALPRPPQWQGSEDILLGTHPESDESEDRADESEAERTPDGD